MSTVVKDLGAVSAYAYAVEKGYTGTEAEFAELMADYADVGQRAEDAAESALNSKTAAQTAATTATTKASEAATSAQTATTKAGEATTAAGTATTAKNDAVAAKTAAETAQGKAEDAQAAAESVAESIPSDYSQLSEDVSDLKEGLNYTNNVIGAYVTNGTATQATIYTDTVVVDNITFDSHCKYNVTLSIASPISVKTYGYIKDAEGNTLMPCNIEANESTASYTYYSEQARTGCKVTFQAGVNNVTVSADVSKNISILSDLEEYAQILNLPTYSGYIKTDGTIGTATSNAEVYTDYVPVDLITKIRYSLVYPTSKVLWLKACVKYKDGSFARLDITNFYSDFEITETIESVAFTYRTYGQCDFQAVAIGLKNGDLTKIVAKTAQTANTAIKKALIAHNNPFEHLPCWDHLFVSRSTTWVTIPHESLFHVRVSRLFGAKVIEANLWKTSDGVFMVNHLSGGKFGGYFHHVDGSTDVSNISPSDVTWSWIVENLRYNSVIEKYQTRPPRLEEFLAECKQQNLIPLITANDPDAVTIIRNFMGNNYIAYDGNRTTSPDNFIFEWKSYTTKEDILNYCNSIGAPLIYGIGNIGDFSDYELKDIIATLHDNGYLVACAYVYDEWAKYASYGIDANAAIQQINRINNGNICNIETLYGFDKFTYTNATETNGVLTFSADGTISPNISADVLDICAVDFELSFTGEITVPVFGEHVNATTITSDGTHPYFQCTPIVGGSPKVVINVSKDTVIYDMKYKASHI